LQKINSKKNENSPSVFTADISKPYTSNMYNDKFKLNALASILSLINISIFEGQQIKGFYSGVFNLISNINNMDVDKLKFIRDNIEKLDKNNHIDILRLLVKNDVFINENKNGVFINLTDLSNDIINDMEKYINYVSEQKIDLDYIENQKDVLENKYFKDNKELNT